MTSKLCWEVFLRTGLPEAYALYRFLREAEETNAVRQISA